MREEDQIYIINKLYFEMVFKMYVVVLAIGPWRRAK